MENESILTSVKADLGIIEEYEHFDQQIVMDINAVFLILNQLGVGPKEGFEISDKTAVWTDYLEEGIVLNMVKKYVSAKVRLMFDTSTLTSPMIEVINKQISEFEWRINIAVDTKEEPEDGE